MDGFTLIMFSFAGRWPYVRFAARTLFHIKGYRDAALPAAPPGIGLLQPLIDADLADTPGIRMRIAAGAHIVLIKPEQGIAGELIAHAAMLEAPALRAPAENTAFA